LVRAKSNIGPDGGGFRYELRQGELAGEHRGIVTSHVEWCGPVAGTAREILATAEHDADPEERSELVDAADWLRARIEEAGGEMAQRDVILEAQRAGHSRRTIQRAKKAAGVISHVTGFGSAKRSTWRLAGASTTPILPIVPSNIVGTHGANGRFGTNAGVADIASEEF
jgi:hypothetical protein